MFLKQTKLLYMCKTKLFYNHRTLDRTNLCLHFGHGSIHVFLTVLQDFNNILLCVCRLGERRDEAFKDGSLERHSVAEEVRVS